MGHQWRPMRHNGNPWGPSGDLQGPCGPHGDHGASMGPHGPLWSLMVLAHGAHLEGWAGGEFIYQVGIFAATSDTRRALRVHGL